MSITFSKTGQAMPEKLSNLIHLLLIPFLGQKFIG